jgi:hypothetical protein
MTLPPPIYTPPPKAKPAPRRTTVGRAFKSGSTSGTTDVDDTDDTEDIHSAGRQINPLTGRSDKDGSSEDGDTQKRKPPSMSGLLSDSTLKVLLQLQEQTSSAESGRRTD